MLRDERCESPGYFGIVESIPGRNDVLRGRQERFSNPPVALPFYYPRYTSVQCLALLTSPLTLTITVKCYDEIVLAIIDGMSRMYTSQENVNDMRENEKKLAERTLLKLFNMEKF